MSGSAKPGWVYAIWIVDSYCKIGITCKPDPYIRIKNLMCDVPYEVRIVGLKWVDDALAEERRLHQIYSQWRVRGEWFDLTREQIDSLMDAAGLQQRVAPRAEFTQKQACEMVRLALDGATT